MTRALVIGLGSIGLRHQTLLREMGIEVHAVSRRGGEGCFSSEPEAVRVVKPDYAVIATETTDHLPALARLAETGFNGRLLMEKPLFGQAADMPANCFASVHVAFPLRFNPGLMQLKEHLTNQDILSAEFYVGQYLPDWRPGRDYRSVYSARRAAGGGVLRDLSHELDLANWLLGPWRSIAALGGQWSPLEIDSDDVFALLGRFTHCRAATLQLNYLDRISQRRVVVNTADHSYAIDLIAGTLKIDREPAFNWPADRNATMIAMHRAVLGFGAGAACDLAGGLMADRLAVAAEKAAATGCWVGAEDSP